jgi:flagellar biosynthesis protein FlhF
MALSHNTASATLLNFPRVLSCGPLNAALKRHRLPEMLAAALVRETASFAGLDIDAALAAALTRRLAPAPIDFEKARGILLVGPSGCGKSAVAAKIAFAAKLQGRAVQMMRADGGLALFRKSAAPELLTVMEADGFNPLNARAASAFSALGQIDGVESIGVISALSDAEDVCDIVRAFRYGRVIVTNMDRTRRLGAAVAAMTGGARLAHITSSPHPQDALENLAPGTLASRLLDAQAH